MRHPVLIVSITTALLFSTAASQDPVALRSAEAHTIEVSPTHEGPAVWSFSYVAGADSVLHCQASSDRMEVTLSIRSVRDRGTLEDDDSGGFGSAFIEIRNAAAGETFALEVKAKTVVAGRIVVRVFEGASLPALDDLMLGLESSFGRIGELIDEREYVAAGDLLEALVARTRGVESLRICRAVLVSAAHFAPLVGRQDLAVECLDRTLPWYRRSLAPTHPWLLACQANLAVTLTSLRDPAPALPLFEAVAAAYESKETEPSVDGLMARAHVAACLGTLGRTAEALPLHRSVVASLGRLLAADDPVLLRARTNLATALTAVGELEEATESLRSIVEAFRRTRPPGDRDRLLAETNLATNLRTSGYGEAALEKFQAVVSAYREYPDDSPDRLFAESNLAATLEGLGREAEAAALLRDVFLRYAASQYEGNPDLVMIRTTLANSLRLLGYPEEALEHDRAAVAGLSGLPEIDPRRVWATKGLAATLYTLGRFHESAEALHEVVAAFETFLPRQHPYLLTARSNLATALARTGEFEEAISLLQRALEAAPRDRRQRLDIRYSLALMLDEVGDEEEASKIFSLVADEWFALAEEGAPALESRSNLVSLLLLLGRRDDAIDAAAHLIRWMMRTAARSAVNCVPTSGEVEDRCLSLVLSCLHGSGDLASESLSAIESCANAQASRLHWRRRGLREVGGDVARLHAHVRRLDCRIEEMLRSAQTDDLEKTTLERDRLSLRLLEALAADPVGRLCLPAPDLSTVASSLGADTVGIRFVSYDHWTYNGPPPRRGEYVGRHLAALVLHGNGRVLRLELGTSAPIRAAAKAWSSSDATARKAAADLLRRRVVEPLTGACGEFPAWVVVPCPETEVMVLEALDAGTPPRPLGDRHAIYYRTSLADLAFEETPRSARPDLVVFGGLDFDAAVDAREAGEVVVDFEGTEGDDAPDLSTGWSSLARVRDLGSGGRRFPALEASEAEAEEVVEVHRRARPRGRRIAVVEEEGSRRVFEYLAPKTTYLHLATHAYFAPEQFRGAPGPASGGRDGFRSSFDEFLDPRSRASRRVPHALCGVAFSGANLDPASAGDRFTMSGTEISQLDLTGCDLVVLSACGGHDGRRTSSGFASLADAFRIAGARTVIASLWPVSDEPTRVLMKAFYRRLWSDGLSKAEALRGAVSWMRAQKGPDKSPLFDARDWAAWRLVGAPD